MGDGDIHMKGKIPHPVESAKAVQKAIGKARRQIDETIIDLFLDDAQMRYRDDFAENLDPILEKTTGWKRRQKKR